MIWAGVAKIILRNLMSALHGQRHISLVLVKLKMLFTKHILRGPALAAREGPVQACLQGPQSWY